MSKLEDLLADYKKINTAPEIIKKYSHILDVRNLIDSVASYEVEIDKDGKSKSKSSGLSVTEVQNLFHKLTSKNDKIKLAIDFIIYKHLMSILVDEEFLTNYTNFVSYTNSKEAELYRTCLSNNNPFIYKLHVFTLVKELSKTNEEINKSLFIGKKSSIAINAALIKQKHIVTIISKFIDEMREKVLAFIAKTSYIYFLTALSLKAIASCFTGEARQLYSKEAQNALEKANEEFTNTIIETKFFADSPLTDIASMQNIFTTDDSDSRNYAEPETCTKLGGWVR